MAKDVLPKLATTAISSAIDKLERKISGKGAVKAGEGFTFFISNEDMEDRGVAKKSGPLIDGATETVKHKIK